MPPCPTNPLPFEESATYRILDAAANRATEGLRVIEDFVRFALDDVHLTGVAKQLRHDLVETLCGLPHLERHTARDTSADVGTGVETAQETSRADLRSVAQASQKRLEQSLRSLEEFAKLIDIKRAAAFESIRYRAYMLGRAVELTSESLVRLERSRLYVLLDGQASLSDFRRLVESLVGVGTHLIQLRDKNLSDRDLIQLARVMCEVTRESETIIVINDRPDIARLSHADGVHVGQDDLSVKDVRAVVGPRMLIGVSTHSAPQARQAVLDGASYLGIGPTYPSETKTFNEFPGLKTIREVASQIRLPAFALGGITVERLAEVREAGLDRVAVGTAIAKADDPAAVAKSFLELLLPTRGSE